MMQRTTRLPLALAGLLAVTVATATHINALTGGGGIYAIQADSAARGGDRTGDRTLPAGLRLRDNLFRTPAAGLPNPSICAGVTSGDGTGNRTLIEMSGKDNFVAVRQHGAQNTASFVQLGSANRLDALQTGTGKNLHVSLIGSGNALGLVQRGEENRYSMDFRGSGLDQTVIQEGVGPRATQVGVASLPFGIQERGNGMEITIQHNGNR